MKYTHFMDKYPVYTKELLKAGCSFSSVDEILTLLEAKVEANPVSCKIGLFDHYAHTSSLPEGEIAPNLRAAKHLVFCFGIKLPGPEAMAVRPRSIGVCEMDDSFVISFMEAPNPQMNAVMTAWVEELAEACSPDAS